MRLTLYTDYSLRVLMYLALHGQRRANIAEIAARYRISENHLVKVVHGLVRGGFVTSYRGKGGGIALAHAADDINVGKVVRFCEGQPRPAECFGSDNACVITGACGLTEVLAEACDSFLSTLDRYTLADLVRRRSRLTRLLAATAV
jgi:Rrf2 family nitric oxide-sensitive transcriptional repressor